MMRHSASAISVSAISTLNLKEVLTDTSVFWHSLYVQCAIVAWTCYTQRFMGVVTMTTKRFSKGLFAKYDKMARDATVDYFKKLGFIAVDNEDRYGQDLIVQGETDTYPETYFVECEVKALWREGNFPFPNVQLPYRKKKFLNKPTQFFIWNEACTRAMTFWSHDVKQLDPVIVENKFVASGEKFYQIPMNMVQEIHR